MTEGLAPVNVVQDTVVEAYRLGIAPLHIDTVDVTFSVDITLNDTTCSSIQLLKFLSLLSVGNQSQKNFDFKI